MIIFDMKSILTKKSVVSLIIIITGILSILLALLTYYGSYSGNFIVILDRQAEVRSIYLSDNAYFNDSKPRLFANSVKDATPIVYTELNLKDAINTDGNYIDPEPNTSYFAYTFYIKNNGNQIVDIGVEYLITDAIRNADAAIRVVVIINNDIDNLDIYMKKDDEKYDYDEIYSSYMPKAKYFINDKLVFTEEINQFAPSEVRKYTIITYIEGNDPDCDDLISGGLIKMSMKFSIIDDKIKNR